MDFSKPEKFASQLQLNHKKLKHAAGITRFMAEGEKLTTFDSWAVKGYDAAI